MEISVIPWRVFFDTLRKQQSSTIELWLRRWLFTNEGAILADQRATAVNYSDGLLKHPNLNGPTDIAVAYFSATRLANDQTPLLLSVRPSGRSNGK